MAMGRIVFCVGEGRNVDWAFWFQFVQGPSAIDTETEGFHVLSGCSYCGGGFKALCRPGVIIRSDLIYTDLKCFPSLNPGNKGAVV